MLPLPLTCSTIKGVELQRRGDVCARRTNKCCALTQEGLGQRGGRGGPSAAVAAVDLQHIFGRGRGGNLKI